MAAKAIFRPAGRLRRTHIPARRQASAVYMGSVIKAMYVLKYR
jgi:hypothetical protein